jgi:hypothetical protein
VWRAGQGLGVFGLAAALRESGAASATHWAAKGQAFAPMFAAASKMVEAPRWRMCLTGSRQSSQSGDFLILSMQWQQGLSCIKQLPDTISSSGW